MSNNGRDIPWVNGQLYIRNRNQFTFQQLEPFAGQCVAFNLEGSQILASGADRVAVEGSLVAAGVDPGCVVVERIPELWEDTWL